ncbi:hypothetical protein [Pinibacter soli]|uniref:Uncharacterized protein n=1 Tax=Pinibacter soli TaxID=3044211 RepID=A0ABT6R7D8_9BACT|nr:hypothetical protein [Pinibacter soli]MDI3318483.1 hypothetical protein [Pinibacter soli]
MKKEDIQHKVEEVMQSLDGAERAEASPFIYSKVMNRLQNRSVSARKFLRLSWELAFAMILFTGLNIAAFFYFNQDDNQNDDNGSITSLANEYTINSNNYNYN